MNLTKNNFAIILAGGSGTRLGSKIPKAFIKYKGQEIYKYSLSTFLSIKQIKKVVLVIPKGYEKKVKISDKRVILTIGGKDRNQSFEKGIEALSKYVKYFDRILIHDAARINVKKQDILRLLKSQECFGTLCYKGPKNNSDLRLNNLNIQTPQFVTFYLYLLTQKTNSKGKDLFTYLNLQYDDKNFIISSNKENNFKITYREDLQR